MRESSTEQKETNAEYHADLTHYSHSMLEVYRRSPALFDAIYISQTIASPPPTPAMVLGSLVHCLVLEYDRFGDTYFIAAGCESRRGKAWAASVEEAERTGLECVLPAQVQDAKAMAKAIMKHPVAAKLLALDGVNEQPIRWRWQDDGLRLKCKPDRVITYDSHSIDGTFCVELKSSITPTPDEFMRQAYKLGYHRQAAHYAAGCIFNHGWPCNFIYVVVGKDEPHDVFVYQPDDEFLELGSHENTITCVAIESSLERNEWHAKDQNELQTLSLPAWARRKLE